MKHLSEETAAFLLLSNIKDLTNKSGYHQRKPAQYSYSTVASYAILAVAAIIIILACSIPFLK